MSLPLSSEYDSALSSNQLNSIVRPNSSDENLTAEAYRDLYVAKDFFNERLFGGELPDCILSFARQKNMLGYFCVDRFENTEGKTAHEIALNPTYLKSRSDAEALSTLVHELCHLWRHVLGPLNRRGGRGSRGYHDLPWAEKMLEVGLCPTDTGLPGGKMTGYRVTHLIVEGGQFDLDCNELLACGFKLNWHDRVAPPKPQGGAEEDVSSKPLLPRKKDRIKFTCPGCQLNAWAKPSAELTCTSCVTCLIPNNAGAKQ